MVKRIKKLTPEQKARMKGWTDKWIEICLHTGAADREKFAKGAEKFYRYVSDAWPGNVVWTPSPMVLALAAPVALAAAKLRRHRLLQNVANDAVRDVVDRVVHRAVGDDAVGQAMRRSVLDAVNSAVRGVVMDDSEWGDSECRNVHDYIGRVFGDLGTTVADVNCVTVPRPRLAYNVVCHTVRQDVIDPVRDATACVGRGVYTAFYDVVAACDHLMPHAISARCDADEALDYDMAFHVIAGVLQASYRWECLDDCHITIQRNLHGSHISSVPDFGGEVCSNYFFREVCGLECGEDALAYKATLEAAHLWCSLSRRDFVMACEHPTAIYRESRQGRADDLHCEDGPAIAYQDGWGVYAVHGVEIPFRQRHIIERPQTITVEEIETEQNAEIRRMMIDRYGLARYVADSDATVVCEFGAGHPVVGLRTARLLYKDVPDYEPIIYADLLNSTPEPDGTVKRYMLRIDPEAYDGEASYNLQAAVASTWRNADGSLVFKDWRDYAPDFES